MSDSLWKWPNQGPTALTQGLDEEMFDTERFPFNETVVREAIQNSLDARLPNQDAPVEVRFRFHAAKLGARKALLNDVLEFRRKAGLPVPSMWERDDAEWLTVEDFNAKGLEGDLGKRGSDFWNYWLNFGKSNKDPKKRGGRGIGRVTFLISSQMQTVIGLTRRKDDGLVAACGMAVLTAVEDDANYKSTHAFLANSEKDSIYELFDTDRFHSQLVEAFELQGYRADEDESGLALVIPYPHPDLTDNGIIASTIEHFAPAILGGLLAVTVDETRLSSDNIDSLARASMVREKFNTPAIKANPAGFMELIREGMQGGDTTISVSKPNRKDFAEQRSSSEAERLRKKFLSGSSIVFDVTFPLERNGTVTQVSATISAAPSAASAKPIDRLFRDGMGLPNVTSHNPGEIDLVILVKDEDLSAYLNLCEGKAHLDFEGSQSIVAKLKSNGYQGRNVRDFVKALPDEVRSLLMPEITQPDTDIFSEFFSVPVKGADKKPKPKPEPPGRVPPIDPPQPKPAAAIVETLSDGVRIKANPHFSDWPVDLRVTFAYADGTRKPSWSKYDFMFDDLNITAEQCTYEHTNNRVKLLNCLGDFSFEVRGFDANRELVANIYRMAKQDA